MTDIPMELHRHNMDRGRRADISLANQLGRSIQRNGYLRQQIQNLIMDLDYGDDKGFVKKELQRILLET